MKKIIVTAISLIILQSCTLTRCFTYYKNDIYDYRIFPYTEVNTSGNAFHFKQGDTTILENYIVKARNRNKSDTIDMTLNDYLEKTTKTVSFIVIRNDSILFEKYYRKFDRSHISTIFSISKSVTSLLTGIAIDDGHITSVTDPVTKYIPELNDADPMFKKLTIEHLLNMRSGIKAHEDKHAPWSILTKFYYGTNLLAKIKRLEFAHEPGAVHEYLSPATAILGMVVQRATGMELGKYLELKVWQPLEMENNATWSIDDKRHRATKAFCGLNTTAIDLAKIGRLYRNYGQWEGNQIIDSMWIARSVTPNEKNDGYQYLWYSTSADVTENDSLYYKDSTYAQQRMSKTGFKHYEVWQDPQHNNHWRIRAYLQSYYALGLGNQVLYVNPKKNIIVVRLGEDRDNTVYPNFIYELVERL